MFESIRKHSKIAMFLLFLLIIPSFILVGIDSTYFSGSSPVVALVNGHEITQTDWDNAHRQESDRIRAQQPNINAALLDTPEARYTTLERLVRERVLQTAVHKSHLVTSDGQLARHLSEIPQIAALRRTDGTLDIEGYKTLVATQGLTPEGFEAAVRNELAVNQVLGNINATAFSTPAQTKVTVDALLQRREVQLLEFKPAHFAAKVAQSPELLEEYYKANPAKFQQPEQASIEYVLLDLPSVAASISLNEADLRTYYQENIDRLAGKEERRASHILITAAKDAPAAERDKAKARAQELLEQARKNPSSFADLAKKSSQDPGSAPQGGDLGFFARGAMVKPFEDTSFALKKGEISDVVESEFGYHVIQLTDIKTPRQPSFEELRPRLEAEMRQQQAQRKFAEVAEMFSNTVYEQAESLQPVAEKLGLKVQTAIKVQRKPAPGTTGVLASEKLLTALFSEESIAQKRNTEALEIGSNQLVAARITAYQGASTLAFNEVREQVQKLYVGEKSAELARKEGEARLAAWQVKPEAATGLSAPLVLSRDQRQNQTAALVDAVLSAKTDKLPAWVGVDLNGNGYVLARINRIVPRETSDASLETQRQQQYVQWLATAESQAYYEFLKTRFKVQIKAPRPTASTEKN